MLGTNQTLFGYVDLFAVKINLGSGSKEDNFEDFLPFTFSPISELKIFLTWKKKIVVVPR